MNEEYNKILANEIINTIYKTKETIIGYILINIVVNIVLGIIICYLIQNQ